MTILCVVHIEIDFTKSNDHAHNRVAGIGVSLRIIVVNIYTITYILAVLCGSRIQVNIQNDSFSNDLVARKY